MNRLWVRISLVVGCLVIFIALLPFLVRRVTPPPDWHTRPPITGLSDRQAFELRSVVERRESFLWLNIFRTVVIGAAMGLMAGVLMSQWLAAPLRQLEKGAQALAEGKLDYRVPVQGSREVRSVAQAFNRMAQKLDNAEVLRRNMLADVTHELRHPIHVIQGSLEAILDGVYPLDMGEVAGLLDQTQHLASLVDDLHELAQAESQRLVMNMRETDLSDLTTKVTESFRPLAIGKKIQLQIEVPAQPVIRMIDPERIRQVLQNLLNNALRYTPEEGCISVIVRDTEGCAEISVQDTGMGIQPEHLAHVFDRFYTADPSRSRKTAGTGLGLAIAQAIVQAHGGTIQADSPGKDQGSTFTIRL